MTIPSSALSVHDLALRKNKIKKIFMYRICGTGMGATACLLKEKGYHIEGCDLRFYPPMGDYLKRTGIPLHDLTQLNEEKQIIDLLKRFDAVVVGNVIPKGGVDAQRIEKSGVPYCSFPAALGGLVLGDVNVVGVAGTHGKTTTTYLLEQIFMKIGMHPGHFIGGVIDELAPAAMGDGRFFFIESDEYDSAYFEKYSKFRSYSIDNLILTSLEFDHGDIFKNVEEIKEQFRLAMPEIKKTIVASADYPAILELVKECGGNWILYGDNKECGPYIDQLTPEGSRFHLRYKGRDYNFNTNLVGRHNVLNLAAGLLYALAQGISGEVLNHALSDLKMVKRRQEVRGLYKSSIVIDDFAHHPRAVEYTVESIKLQFPERKIWVVLDPASATARSDVFQKEFVDSLMKSDGIILAKPERASTVKGRGNLDCEKLVSDLKLRGKEAYLAKNVGDILQHLDTLANSSTLFLILSNTTCLGLWESEFVQSLEK
ncbi:MAG: hypothetical protein HYV97_17185 [Bdellovibrio sp.]|nr:hypothetical protein [Bdellovibrio sp.]